MAEANASAPTTGHCLSPVPYTIQGAFSFWSAFTGQECPITLLYALSSICQACVKGMVLQLHAVHQTWHDICSSERNRWNLEALHDGRAIRL